MPRSPRWPARSRKSGKSIRRPGWSSTTRRTSGRRSLRPCARRWRRRSSRQRTSPRSASPTSARPRWCGIARSGKPIHNAIVWQDRRTRRHLRGACGAPATRTRFRPRPGSCSIPISRRRKSPGCSIMSPARARRRRRGGSHSAPSTAFSCGGSPAARSTRPTPPMRRAPCCSISARGKWDRATRAICSEFRRRCCRRCATARRISGTRSRELFGGPISDSAASPATSRRQPSVRAASSPA